MGDGQAPGKAGPGEGVGVIRSRVEDGPGAEGAYCCRGRVQEARSRDSMSTFGIPLLGIRKSRLNILVQFYRNYLEE